MAQVYLLTGRPGTGKTSLIKQVVGEFQGGAGGFYTEEIRVAGERLGFKLVTLDGEEAVLAHVEFNKRFRVGKYGVNVEALERVGVPAIEQAVNQRDLVVVDEIGRMKLFSGKFRDAVLAAVNSGKRVLGTIMLAPHPWADAVKKLPRVKVIELTRKNYPQVQEELRSWLKLLKVDG